MASHFMGKISSLFRQPVDGRALLLPDSHNDSNDANANESPPPYNSSREAVVTDKRASPTSPSSLGRLQICPHETLSFERLQRIAKLPNFRQHGRAIDALKGSPQQHIRGRFERKDSKEDGNIREVLPNPQDKNPLIQVNGHGEILYNESDTGTGLILMFRWNFNLM